MIAATIMVGTVVVAVAVATGVATAVGVTAAAVMVVAATMELETAATTRAIKIATTCPLHPETITSRPMASRHIALLLATARVPGRATTGLEAIITLVVATEDKSPQNIL